MSKKIFLVFLIMFLVVFYSICFATDSINMDLSNSTTLNTSSDLIDTTTIDGSDSVTSPSQDDQIAETSMPTVSTTTDYDNSGELSVTNIINIILIVVGIVIIFLGIAIIIKIK